MERVLSLLIHLPLYAPALLLLFYAFAGGSRKSGS